LANRTHNHGDSVRDGNEIQKDDIIRMAEIAAARGDATVLNKGRIIGPGDRDKIQVSRDNGRDAEVVIAGKSTGGATRRSRAFWNAMGDTKRFGP
jgi:hypothetical protein